MSTSRLASIFAMGVAVVVNGVVIVLAFLMSLLGFASDIGLSEAIEWSSRWIGVGVAAFVVIIVMLDSTRSRWLVVLAYATCAGLLVFSGSLWIEHFNTYNEPSPPSEPVALGAVAVINFLLLVTTRPLDLAPIWRYRWSRSVAVVGVVVVSTSVAWLATTYFARISRQYAYADQLDAVYWDNGWVVAVNLKGTEATDVDLRHLEHFPQLESLNLSGTQITDVGLVHIEELSSLESVYLTDTAVTDQGLASLSGLTRLRNLYLRSTAITDLGLVHLQDMRQMGYLDLSQTEVSDAGLSYLHGMKHLYYLHVPETAVTVDGLQELTQMLPKLSAYNGSIRVGRQ